MITVIKFYADWCGPCKAMQPTWEKLEELFDGEVIFQSVDIEANPNLRQEHNVRSIPTLIMFKDGKELARRQGSGSLTELEDWIDEQGSL